MQDLAGTHHPISDFITWPESEDEWEALKLTDEQVANFHEHGYLAGVQLLDERQIDRLLDELDDFFRIDHEGRDLWYEYHTNESIDPSKILFHALGAWRIRPCFHDLLWCPRLLIIASQLLEGDVRFWHDQLFCKPAHHGGVVAWHQDYSYWTRTQPMAHLTCWLGLDPSTHENGCVHYVPGSHRWNLLPITGLAGDMDAIRSVLNEEQWQQFQNPVAVELTAGSCSFHHPLTVHGSFENRTEIPRRATVVNLIKDGVMSDSDEPLLKGIPPISPGTILSGKYFPMLFRQHSKNHLGEPR